MNTAKQLLWLPTTREEKYKTSRRSTDCSRIAVNLGAVAQVGPAVLPVGHRVEVLAGTRAVLARRSAPR
jgi:hypothetical protein